ncbi:hypothetical protein MAPG_09814 [Magnaporthiopsis poae ATCC 64411]|uniref:Uncharacterized protein n=1 Tax=Magnaporthiopsis poae (strain ATCC 64411 / 73-15) TaxID=644358 RepID=A0A0C4EAX7_MAGP6|nr:hypothetical protein MAPG_09814 [Magnaporthiopsis poae ATCC 64411]
MQMTYYFDLSGACPGIHKWPFDFLDRTPMDEYAPRWSILYSHGAVDSQDDLNTAPIGSNRRPKPQLRPPLFPPSPPPSPPCARYQHAFPSTTIGPRDEGPPPFVDMSRKPAYRERSDSAGSSYSRMSGVSFSVTGSVRSPANGQLPGPAEPPPPARHIPAARSHSRAPPAELLGLGHALRKKPAVCDLKEANDDGGEVWAWAVTAEMYALQRRRR